jgi:hypothetical protein
MEACRTGNTRLVEGGIGVEISSLKQEIWKEPVMPTFLQIVQFIQQD